MRCLNPAPLHHQLGLAVLLACGKRSQNIGLVCIIKTSFQKASQPMKHCFLEGIGGCKRGSCLRILAPSAAEHARRRWALALQNAVNTAKNCCAERWAVVLSVLFLLWLARVLRGPCFFPVGFRAFWRARARDPSHKTVLFTVFCCICVSGLACGLLFLGCCYWGLWRARASDPMSAFWVRGVAG